MIGYRLAKQSYGFDTNHYYWHYYYYYYYYIYHLNARCLQLFT